MATAVNQKSSPGASLRPLVVCPGHEFINSVHPSRQKAKEVGFKWLEEPHKENGLIECDFDVRKDFKAVHVLICSYRHQDIENCPNPFVIFPSEQTACSGHRQVFKLYNVYEEAKKAGFKWLDEQQKDTHYTDCSFEVPKQGKKYALVYSYKHQNLDPSANPYLRFPCQFLVCLGHPHVASVHSKEKSAEKEGSKWLNKKQKDQSCTDFQKVILKGPQKNYALIHNFKHLNIDYCPKPHPILPECVSCPGHTYIYKTYETRKKAKQIGRKWLHEKQKDSYYQNCSFDVKDVAHKVHNLVCYFEHQTIKGCLNSRTAFDHFVEKDHLNLIEKASQFYDKNRKTILKALVMAGCAAAAVKEIAGLVIAAREANSYDFLFRNLANAIKPHPIIHAPLHPPPASPFDSDILQDFTEEQREQIFLDFYSVFAPESDLGLNRMIEFEKESFSHPTIDLPPPYLKPFLNLEEALLRLPLELDEEALYYAEPQTYYKPSQIASYGDKKCAHGASCFMNGMLYTLEKAYETTQALSEMQGGNQIDLIYNSTLGAQRDLIKQTYINNNYLIPAGQLMKNYIINYFEHAGPNQVLHINVHSQGGAILNKILPEIPKEYRDRMYIDTYGTAGYIDGDMAMQVRNIWHPNDKISKMADPKGWEKAKKNGTLVILENDGKSYLDAHGLMSGYLLKLRENNKAFAEGNFL